MRVYRTLNLGNFDVVKIMSCPRCGYDKAWKNGHRKGSQRWLCKNCGLEYFDQNSSKHDPIIQTRSLNNDSLISRISQSCTRGSSPQSAGLLGLESLAQKKEEGEMQTCDQLQNSDLLKCFPDQLKPKLLQYAAKEWNKGRSIKSVETYILSR